ncbi:SAM-dependent methyltransferase [Fulvivirga imtechensis AK7]|uniref:SAM-dependent methyltransferase n=1 Tax=Fulvivirga imtechensis AK7 TaxID=1237149 RepID=L8JXP6_9BACT|nr:class I SAM-dependent methyltransferase [Fulvivirga imtechensis]ELR72953.1 SAM-dependent methyltransferase [Fulvivirga imtechensis AK7]
MKTNKYSFTFVIMLEKILLPQVQQFIKAHEKEDPFSLSLKYKEVAGLPIKVVAEQIAARQKAKNKLPEWHHTEGIIFPPLISMEQCSSEASAKYKSTLISGRTLIDLTGGAGVDTYYLAKNFTEVHYIEQNHDLAQIIGHNLRMLNVDNLEIHECTAEAFLERLKGNVDNFYIDPARRDNQQQKVFRLEDCTPDVLQLLPQLLEKGRQTLIKTSPMLDLPLAINDLKKVKEVHVVSVDGECKEVLYLIDHEGDPSPKIITINLKKNGTSEIFAFKMIEEADAQVSYSQPKIFLYEPNASILKAGGFKVISGKYRVDKLHQHTHLYTSSDYVDNFPGRSFKIIDIIPYNKKAVARLVPEKKANITTRNFPDDVAVIRKKLNLKDGGNKYLFAYTDVDNQKKIAVTEKT